MENINFFGGDSIGSDEELPWIKDWAKGTLNPQNSQGVVTVKVCDKGLYLETEVYKAFIYKKQSIYGFLIEALELWSTTKLPTNPLVICSDVKGKAFYGIHEEKPEVTWSKNEGLYYSHRIMDGKPLVGKIVNPFLQSNSPALPREEEVKPKRKGTPKTEGETSTEASTAS